VRVALQKASLTESSSYAKTAGGKVQSQLWLPGIGLIHSKRNNTHQVTVQSAASALGFNMKCIQIFACSTFAYSFSSILFELSLFRKSNGLQHDSEMPILTADYTLSSELPPALPKMQAAANMYIFPVIHHLKRVVLQKGSMSEAIWCKDCKETQKRHCAKWYHFHFIGNRI